MPNSMALYFQGSQALAQGTVFGDGLRCAGGTLVRLAPRDNSGGMSQYPNTQEPPISQLGMIVAPGTRTYQVWYRNKATFCAPAGFNLTNALRVTWQS